MRPDALPGIEIRHLVALKAIADTRSFSKAAETLGYAQSAVSQQIATLEKAVGVQLILRPGGPRPVSLTEAGTVLLRHGERILARLGAARADLEALAAGAAGTVRVGTFQSTGARVLPAVLSRFRATWPHVRVELIERQDDRDLFDLVGAGALDLTFGVEGQEREAAFEFQHLLDDPYVVLAPPTSPFLGRDSVDPRELDGMDFIDHQAVGSCDFERMKLFRSIGVFPNVVFRTDDNLTLQRLVGTGLGHACVPTLTVERGVSAGSVVAIPVSEPLVRRIGLFWRTDRYRSPVAEAFAEIAFAVCDAGDYLRDEPVEVPVLQ
jgi:DNA-binding transcriptional LysR family regulator